MLRPAPRATLARPSRGSLDLRGDAEHVPLYEPLGTALGRWVRAAELVPGDTVATRAGTATVVRVAPHGAPEVVYNLRVERTARYLVGACGAVVHNSPCDRAREAAEVLHRFGTAPESAGRLARKAEEAKDAIGIHGVSVTAREVDGAASSASRDAIEREFKVHDTPTMRDPLHRTIELPSPVTQSVADAFNRLFGRRR